MDRPCHKVYPRKTGYMQLQTLELYMARGSKHAPWLFITVHFQDQVVALAFCYPSASCVLFGCLKVYASATELKWCWPLFPPLVSVPEIFWPSVVLVSAANILHAPLCAAVIFFAPDGQNNNVNTAGKLRVFLNIVSSVMTNTNNSSSYQIVIPFHLKIKKTNSCYL